MIVDNDTGRTRKKKLRFLQIEVEPASLTLMIFRADPTS